MFDDWLIETIFNTTLTFLILVVILSFVTSILIYMFCNKVVKRPLLNIPISLALLAYSVYDRIYSYRITWGMEVDVVQNFLDFFKGESLMVVYYLWMPGVISFTLINIAFFIERQMKKEAKK